MSSWIKTAKENKEFLESLGVEVGEYVKGYFENCLIPSDAENELFEYWGNGKDSITFGEYKKISPAPGTGLEKIKGKCRKCHSITLNGICSYLLCPSEARKSAVRVQ